MTALEIHELLTASTLTPREKGLLTRRCRKLAEMNDGAEEYLRDEPLYQLASAAVQLRCVEAMQLALRLWHAIPAPQRERIERRATYWKARAKEECQRAYTFREQERARAAQDAATAKRFGALYLALEYGSAPTDALVPLVKEAYETTDYEKQGAALLIWDLRPTGERDTIILAAERALARALAAWGRKDPETIDVHWLRAAIETPGSASEQSADVPLTESEQRRLRAMMHERQQENGREMAAD